LFSNTIHDGLLPNDDKINLFRTKFSIAIENNKEKYYFSEKLVDCLLTKTIPIYWGCSEVGRFFDEKGIIIFDTFDELLMKINSIDEKTYDQMLPHVENNYRIALEYGRSIFDRVKEAVDNYRKSNVNTYK
jgi:hypothetical protein